MKNLTLRLIPILIFALLVAIPSLSTADTLTMKDGQVLKGTFMGMDGGNYKFEAFGNTMTIEADKVLSLEVENRGETPAAQSGQVPEPQKQGSITVSPGTALLVKMQSGLATDKSKKGDPFITVLEKDVTVEGKRVFPRGTKVYGRVMESVKAGRVAGQAKLIIALNEIETRIGTIAISTHTHEYQGPRSGTLRKVAVGAAIGNVASQGSYRTSYKKGAQTGAAYGGIVAVMTPGNQIAIEPGTLAEFILSAPVRVE